jgi:aerobic-type carbon monoxide dehydrogenase small subunit (CoxS/CutS family)
VRLLPEWRDPHGQAFLDQNPKATDDQIHQAMSTVLCRCFSSNRMLRAIKKYATERA